MSYLAIMAHAAAAAISNVLPFRREDLMRLAATSIPLDDPRVERPAPGKAPTAFRIWAAGENDSDEGPIYFTRRSAELLMAEQDARGRLYASDFNHLSLSQQASATGGKASGWHRLSIRPDDQGEPELWAESIDWTEEARAGIEKPVPEWRYFSPAFLADKKTREIKSYLNFALCINPLTHDLPSLAAAGPNTQGSTMTKEALLAAYAKICSAEATEDEKKAAHEAMRAHLDALPAEGGGVGKIGEQENGKDKGQINPAPDKPGPDEQDQHATGDNDPGYTDEEKQAMAHIKATAQARKAAAGGPDDPGNKWPSKSDKPATGKSPKAGETTTEARAMAAVGHELLSVKKELGSIKVQTLIDKHPELSESLRAWCATQPFEVVESFLKAAPTKLAARNSSVVRGADDGTAPGLQGAELEEVNKLMGIRPAGEKQFERRSASEGGGFVIRTIRPSEARERDAQARQSSGR